MDESSGIIYVSSHLNGKTVMLLYFLIVFCRVNGVLDLRLSVVRDDPHLKRNEIDICPYSAVLLKL